MFSSLFSRIKEAICRFKRQRVQPLRTNRYDLHLLQIAKGKKFPSFLQIRQIGRVLSVVEKRVLFASVFILFVSLMWIAGKFLLSHRAEVPANGGIYLEAVMGAPQFVNPIFASTNDVDLDITRMVFSGLMRYDADHRLVTDLAEKYEVSEDKKTYTFTLRKDVVWHDGEPFTARDVVYTFETIQNQLTGSPLFVTFQGMVVSASNENTVQFVLQEPFASFLSSLTVGILPEHLWFEVLPEQMRMAKNNLQPIGTGPFKFKKLLKDDLGKIYRYELERYDKYYTRPAYLNEFVFVFYPDYDSDSGAIKAFREQKVQGINFVPHAWRDKVERKNVNLYTLQLPQYTALFFNQDRLTSLKSKDVRTALASSLDKDRILREVLQEDGKIVDGPILPGFPGYSTDLKKIGFSFEEANKLLDKNWPRISAEDYRKMRLETMMKEWDEANKSVSTTDQSATTTERTKAEEEINKQLDGELQAAQTFYRKNKDNEILEITLVTADNKEYRKTAELVAGFWENIGVKTGLHLVETKDFARTVLKNREYDVLLYGEIVGSDPDPYPFWHSSQIEYPGLNLSKYVNRQADTLIEKLRGSIKEEEVAETYRKFQDIILEELPAVFLYMPTYSYAMIDGVRGVSVSIISHPSDRLAGAVDWYMKTGGEWKF